MRPRCARILALVVLSMLPLLAGCGAGSSSPAPTATPAPTASPLASATSSITPVGGGCVAANTDGNGGPYPAATASDCTGRKSVEVNIVNDPKIVGGFSPSNITISKGTMVTWVWKSGGHNLYPFHNGIEDTGFRFSKTFDTVGTFPYQCQIHPGQSGVVQVR